jgi:hypothetical protein
VDEIFFVHKAKAPQRARNIFISPAFVPLSFENGIQIFPDVFQDEIFGAFVKNLGHAHPVFAESLQLLRLEKFIPASRVGSQENRLPEHPR